MNWIRRRWQSLAVLTLAVAAVAIPAWASSGESGDVQQATEPSGSDSGQVEPAPAPSGSDPLPLASPEVRQHFDDAIQCMADRGFGGPPAPDSGSPSDGDAERGGLFISRAETETDEFKQAAKECELPPPPTDAQIRAIGCGDDQARREGND